MQDTHAKSWCIYEDRPDRRMYMTHANSHEVGLFNQMQSAYEFDSPEDAQAACDKLNRPEVFHTKHYEFKVAEYVAGI